MRKQRAEANQDSAISSVKRPEPIAIVGIGCRFPGGADGAEAFWKLLVEGIDAVREVPSDRWNVEALYDPEPGTPGKTNSRWGGFIDGIDQFDAGFFGISPREAARMDPQQRLLLETAVGALEDAGQPMHGLAGSRTGVFVGYSGSDYAVIQHGPTDRRNIDAHSNTGGAASICANRISYFLDLRGTSFTVDTACSSALVALHLACQSIWRNENTHALAGGVNVLLKPEPFMGFSHLSMLSPDGRCKPFDASANGFVRAEGAGMVLLKPLSAALRDGDDPYAVILATGSNQDGRTSSMTVPSQRAQEELLRQNCKEAGVSPADIHYFEIHGTGTLVGDPIEARALGAVLGEGRPEGDVCLVGSSKSNIGHLEPAAGIAGLIKLALSLKHRVVPPNLHFHEPNPNIPLDELKLRVPQQAEPWPVSDAPALAGINSFGFGGTNAQAILREAPRNFENAEDRVGTGEAKPRLVPLSASSSAALSATAERYGRFVRERRASFEDIVWSASSRRSHYDHRSAVVARTAEELAENLEALASGTRTASVVSGRRVPSQNRRIVFVCSGQGPQWWRMGRELLETEPVFRGVIERCDEIVRSKGGFSLLEELTRDESSSRMEETAIAQPSIFALQVGLAELWKSWGIEPDAVVGHSVGEVAAAHIAGALSLEDAAHVIFHRGRCMDFASAHGRMLAVGLPAEEGVRLLRGREDRVSLAAINSPRSITLSGDGDCLEEVAAQLEANGTFHRFLRVNYAFHSHLMDPMRHELLDVLRGIEPGDVSIPMVSTVTGTLAVGTELDGEYWWRNVREAVRFAPAVQTLLQDGYKVFTELSPHPVLSGAVLECAEGAAESLTVVPSLRRGDEERYTILKSLGSLYAIGCPVNWSAVGPEDGRFVRLPTYPWQRERHWSESEASRQVRVGNSHPLLGRRVGASLPLWESHLDPRVTRYLRDHQVQGLVVFPATGYLEMIFAAGGELFGALPVALEEVELTKACFLSEDEGTLIQISGVDESSVRIHTRRPTEGQQWTEHGRAHLRPLTDVATPAPVDLEAIRRRCPVEKGSEECYTRLREMGLDYGPAFRGLERIWLGRNETLTRTVAPPEVVSGTSGYAAHPAILDSCLQSMLLCASYTRDEVRLFLPVEIERVRLHRRLPSSVWTHVTLVEIGGRDIVADIRIFDDANNTILDFKGARCRLVGDNRESESLRELVYEYEWQLERRPEPVSTASMLPSPETVVERMRADKTTANQQRELIGLNHEFASEVAALCAGLVWSTLDVALGNGPERQERFSTEELIERVGVSATGRVRLEAYLEWLSEDGVLRKVDSGWEARPSSDLQDPWSLWRRLMQRHPGHVAELMLVRRQGRMLPEILGGDGGAGGFVDDESRAWTDHLYGDSPFLRLQRTVVERAVSAVLDAMPRGRELRILELGAVPGSVASHVLPKLHHHLVRYVLADASEDALAKAKEKFREFSSVSFERLDLEGDLEGQDLASHSFDMILDFHGLRAAGETDKALATMSRLLDSRGLLLLVEQQRPVRWLDFVFGAANESNWRETLGRAGFSDVRDCLGPADAATQHAVLLARAPLWEREASRDREAVASSEASLEPTCWVVFCDKSGAGEKLVQRLRKRGHDTISVFPGDHFEQVGPGTFQIEPGRLEDMKQLFDGLEVLGPPRLGGIVHCWNVDAPAAENEIGEASSDHVGLGCLSLVHLVQVIADGASTESPRLWVVTRGAESVGRTPEAVSVLQAPVWGLNRVIMNEHPSLRATSVDLGSGNEEELDALCDVVMGDLAEDEIALRGNARYLHRYTQGDVDSRETTKRVSAGSEAFRLETSPSNVIDKLTLRASERRVPGPGEIEIRVAAAGLNFSDVMKALGLYPGLGDGPVPLGIECSGTVTRVGEGVETLHPGDEVMAVAPFSFGAFVTTRAQLAVSKPKHLSFEEAATIPIAFLTAHYALNYLARIEKGERVLIHSATGGVGLAAIQLVQRAGGEVLATAGTEEKRALLRALGIEHVMDSRTLAFADEVLEITEGRGVDVVLNSLAGDAIRKGLSVLADDGRFLEIGKRDIYQDSQIGLRAFRKNLSLMAIDLDREFRTRPGLISSLFEELREALERRELFALPYRVFPVSNSVGAFRHMAKAKHIGKVVVSLQEGDVWIAPSSERSIRLREDATYLITGGLGGFGLRTAEWLVASGARHLALVGRRGVHSAEAEAQVEALRRAGAEVLVAQADVADREQVSRLLARIAEEMPPLRGVFHAAMVLRDGLLLNMDEAQWRAVWAPKVSGAWNLHEQTAHEPLDFFVLCSSMSAALGAGGQANYAAANTFLDALAFFRRAQGLAGLSVSWGYLGEVGVAARQEDIGRRFEAMGIGSVSPREALELLGRFLRDERVHVGAMRVDWSRWKAVSGGRTQSPRFDSLVREAETGESSKDKSGKALRSALVAADAAERRSMLQSAIVGQLSVVLGTSPEALDVEKPLSDLGLDSLMAVELRNWIERDLRLNLPTVELLRGPSVVELCDVLLDQLSKLDASGKPLSEGSNESRLPRPIERSRTRPSGKTEEAQELLAEVDEMSDERVDALLEEMVARGPGAPGKH